MGSFTRFPTSPAAPGAALPRKRCKSKSFASLLLKCIAAQHGQRSALHAGRRTGPQGRRMRGPQGGSRAPFPTSPAASGAALPRARYKSFAPLPLEYLVAQRGQRNAMHGGRRTALQGRLMGGRKRVVSPASPPSRSPRRCPAARALRVIYSPPSRIPRRTACAAQRAACEAPHYPGSTADEGPPSGSFHPLPHLSRSLRRGPAARALQVVCPPPSQIPRRTAWVAQRAARTAPQCPGRAADRGPQKGSFTRFLTLCSRSPKRCPAARALQVVCPPPSRIPCRSA